MGLYSGGGGGGGGGIYMDGSWMSVFWCAYTHGVGPYTHGVLYTGFCGILTITIK